MPFESDAQRRFMYSQHPELAAEFEKATPKGADLPEHVKKMADGGVSDADERSPDYPTAAMTSMPPEVLSTLMGGLMGGMNPVSAAKEIPSALEGLGEAGEATLGKADPEEVTAFVKGIQKGAPGSEGVKIYGVKGSPAKLKELFGDEAPGSVPENVLRDKGILPAQVPESQNPTAPFAQDLRHLWGDAASEQSGTPIDVRGPYERPDIFLPKKMAEGGTMKGYDENDSKSLFRSMIGKYANGGIVKPEGEEETPPAVAPVAPAAVVNPPAPPAPKSEGGDAAPVAPKDNTAGVASPTHTSTETGGSSPGGASTGGVGSGIGGAGTGGAATGGASTGGAGTVTVTVSGDSGKGKSKGGKKSPTTINISNVGGTTEAGNVASGDGPGSSGTGGKGSGSGGGGGGATPSEPEGMAKGGTFLENETPAKAAKDVHLKMAKGGIVPDDKKRAAVYKAMGIKGYDDGGTPDDTATPAPPQPNDPGYAAFIQNLLSKVGFGHTPQGAANVGATADTLGAVGSALGNALPTMPAVAAGAANAASTPGLAPAINAGLGTNLAAPAAPAPAPVAAAPVAPPAMPPAAPKPMGAPAMPGPAAGAAPSGMPDLSGMFNQDTSKLTQGVNPEDRQAVIDKLQAQQHGLGAIISQAVAGLGDALSAKGGKETHALGNIFAMNTQQRQESLANFDKARQDRVQKLQLQTQMGDNALKQAAAADAYGVDEHLNGLLNAPKGTMKKDLPTYMGIMSAGIAAKEKDEDLYMKAHAQAGTDVDNAIKNSSVLGIKPSSAQVQAIGNKLADVYYNKAKGNVGIKASDGSQHWIPAASLGKAKQMDPGVQVIQ